MTPTPTPPVAGDVRAALSAAIEALEEIALAGMSGTGQESKEGLRDWHACRAWEFIRIAARALEPARSALSAASAAEPQGWRPIETAPAQGEFLVFQPAARRSKINSAWRSANVVFVIGGAFAFDTEPATHWMPLPPAPGASQVHPQQGEDGEPSLEQYRRMFLAACEDLGAINEALGLDPDDGGAEPILAAISERRTVQAGLLTALEEMTDLAVQCDSWQSFPREPIERAQAAIAKATTPPPSPPVTAAQGSQP